jgi:hypothetical protein
MGFVALPAWIPIPPLPVDSVIPHAPTASAREALSPARCWVLTNHGFCRAAHQPCLPHAYRRTAWAKREAREKQATHDALDRANAVAKEERDVRYVATAMRAAEEVVRCSHPHTESECRGSAVL